MISVWLDIIEHFVSERKSKSSLKESSLDDRFGSDLESDDIRSFRLNDEKPSTWKTMVKISTCSFMMTKGWFYDICVITLFMVMCLITLHVVYNTCYLFQFWLSISRFLSKICGIMKEMFMSLFKLKRLAPKSMDIP